MEIKKPVKTKKKKVKKPFKLTLTKLRAIEKAKIKKLTKECKSLCSQICKIQWNGRCAMCGKEGNAAHHFFGWGACSNVRFDTDNLILLEYGCHIGRVHQQGLTEPAREAIIRRIGQERFDILREKAFISRKYTLEDLKDIKIRLQKELEYWSVPF